MKTIVAEYTLHLALDILKTVFRYSYNILIIGKLTTRGRRESFEQQILYSKYVFAHF